MNLSLEEMHRFAAYLSQEARDFTGMAEQMEKMLGLEAGAKRERMLAAAYSIVAQRLASTEAWSVSGVEPEQEKT